MIFRWTLTKMLLIKARMSIKYSESHDGRKQNWFLGLFIEISKIFQLDRFVGEWRHVTLTFECPFLEDFFWKRKKVKKNLDMVNMRKPLTVFVIYVSHYVTLNRTNPKYYKTLFYELQNQYFILTNWLCPWQTFVPTHFFLNSDAFQIKIINFELSEFLEVVAISLSFRQTLLLPPPFSNFY